MLAFDPSFELLFTSVLPAFSFLALLSDLLAAVFVAKAILNLFQFLCLTYLYYTDYLYYFVKPFVLNYNYFLV